MAPTGSLIPADVDLRAIIGADFSATIVLYTDLAQTTPFDLTGYTVSMTIGTLTLTSGSGLTVTVGTGTIVAAITAVQTAALAGPYQHYSLKLVDGGGLVSFPLNGNLLLSLP
jgi:hypothetical protein